MKIALQIGETEKNLLEFDFNQLLGRTVIRVNCREVKKDVRLISEPITESHTVTVGIEEKWLVRIEKTRRQLLGGRYVVWINNRLFNVYQGV